MAEPFDSYPQPIKLVLADLDGTVTSDEVRPLDCDDLRLLRRYNERSRAEPAVPPISLTTGRPHSYLEAFTRFLATPLPSLFESGCGLHLPTEPLGREYLFHPALADPAVAEAVARLRRWAEEELVARRGAGLILGKRYSVSLAAGGGGTVEELQEAVEAMPPDLAQRFFVTRSWGVVDVTPRPVDKGAGLTWLLEYCREELAYAVDAVNVLGIGDSFNDLPFLRGVGLSCAVANAAAQIREAVDYVTREPTGRGVAEVVALATAINERLGFAERHG